MASLPITDDRFDMGRVVSRTFGVIGRNIALFFGLTLLLSALPGLLLRLILGVPNPTDLSRTYVFLAVTIIVSSFFGFILTAALSYATVSDHNGDRPTFGKALGIGLRYAIPLLLLALVAVSGFYIGLIFLVVPGIILGLMWCVAVPAMVSEKLGVFASLGRSRALTKGWRWQILGLLLVAVILLVLPTIFASLLTGGIDGATAEFGINTIVQALLGAAVSMILTTVVAAIYIELRTIKEGASAESLASIFA